MLAPTCISSGSLTPSPRAGCSNDLELAGAVESGGHPGGFHLRFLIPHDVRGGPQALRTCRVRSNPKPMKRERPTRTIRHEGTAEREAQPQRRFRKGVTTKGTVLVVAETGAEVPLASRQQLNNSTTESHRLRFKPYVVLHSCLASGTESYNVRHNTTVCVQPYRFLTAAQQCLEASHSLKTYHQG